MKILKKAMTFALSAFFLLTCASPIFPLAATGGAFKADGYACNLKDGSYVSGTQNIYVSGKAGDSLTLKVDGNAVNPSAGNKPKVRLLYTGGDGDPSHDIKSNNSYNATDMIGLNGTMLGRFPSDGSVGYGMDTAQFKDGENAVFVIIGGYWGNGPYDETKKHGQEAGNQGNTKDDFLLSNVRFELPDGRQVTPDGFISYKAKAVGSTEKVITRYVPYPFTPEQKFWLGDGWGTTDTWYGNTTDTTVINPVDKGRYDIPYKVEFLLNYTKPGSEAIFDVDTTKYSDGNHTVEVYAGSTCVSRENVTVDNSKPAVTANLTDKQTISNGFGLNVSFSDAVSGLKTHRVSLEGKVIGDTAGLNYTLNNLSSGVHSLMIEAGDNAGNTVYQNIDFNVADKAAPVYRTTAKADGSYSLSVIGADNAQVTFYEANQLGFTASYGTADGTKKPASEQAFPDWYAYQMAYGGEPVSTSSASGQPYQAFDVDVSGISSGTVNLSYTGSTTAGERFALKAYNITTSSWDTLATGIGSAALSAPVNVADYASGGKIRVMAMTDYVDNGSSSLLWVTDPQNYTKFADLNNFYNEVYQYAANQYTNRNIGYMVNTGDLVDDNPGSPLAQNEWKLADKALDYAEGIGVPSGVVSGNHDTNDYPSVDYSLFCQYFGAERYRNTKCFGGSLNNNSSHYDLVTIGNTDFVVLYLGYGVEGTPETVAWANQVLKEYSHRNATLCTHQ